MEEIPKLIEFDHKENSPRWVQPTQDEWVGDEHVIHQLKPVVRCKCGQFCVLGLYHVHVYEIVTASFYHKRGTNYSIGESPEGCEWHVFLKLKDYTGGEFLPVF